MVKTRSMQEGRATDCRSADNPEAEIVNSLPRAGSGMMRFQRAAGRARVRADVKIYTLFIHDDRYSVPSLDAVSAADDRSAETLANARLDGSTHYSSIEIWEDERPVGTIARD
jgi:hypothetical protein